MAAPAPAFGTGRLFLADSRLLLMVLNEARHRGLHRAFGTSREQANLLTFVLALAAADAAGGGMRRVIPTSFGLSGENAAVGSFLIKEAAYAIGGPASREVPSFATLLAIAAAGGAALPAVRQAVASLRAAERRARAQRIARYRAATQAAATLASDLLGADRAGQPDDPSTT
jgi:hypothetical protein